MYGFSQRYGKVDGLKEEEKNGKPPVKGTNSTGRLGTCGCEGDGGSPTFTIKKFRNWKDTLRYSTVFCVAAKKLLNREGVFQRKGRRDSKQSPEEPEIMVKSSFKLERLKGE